MCNLQKAFLGAVFVASMLVGTSPGAYAQYQTWNGCPPGWTVQGGACRPYQGPVGGPPPGYGYQPHGYQPYGLSALWLLPTEAARLQLHLCRLLPAGF